ncbi:universal stress protein [Streptomyces sp. NPDC047971]|uniref:universal stress protein n=1 Tax=Streptomyces sp. NPDC047971 TaxID=3154499 RepID=UPI0033E7D318
MDGTRDRPRLGRVVVGVDGSPSSQDAVAWGEAEAVLRGTSLCLVHATNTEGRSSYLSSEEAGRVRSAGRALLDRTAATVAARHPSLSVIDALTGGAPGPGLRQAAAITGTIVVGHRGLGGFSSLLLGSVGLEAVANATTPVVVVRGDGETGAAGRVLVAVRDRNDLGSALQAADEALLREVPLRILHIGNGRSAGGAGTAPDTVAGRVRQEFPDLTVDVDVERSGSVPGALVDASSHADLLVVGGRRAPGYLGPTLGRTTLGLVQHAHCPVELVPRHGAGHGSTS